MKEIFEILKSNPLLEGIGFCEFEGMLSCLEGRLKSFEKGESILLAGSPVTAVGLVVSGSIQVLREDAQGRQNLLAELGGGELFGEVFACAGTLRSPVTVLAVTDCRILLLNYRKIAEPCARTCAFHRQLLQNMLRILAQKNLHLQQKLELLSRRTTRERLLVYFDQVRNGTRQFTLPLNREELAAYLCVDRSALSAELSRMQKDGLLRYRRNDVELTD